MNRDNRQPFTAMVGIHDSCYAVRIHARQIFDSRGKPTVQVELETKDGKLHCAAVPSGASTGIYEAVELRDGKQDEFLGQGVSKAIDNVNKIIGPALLAANLDLRDQTLVDNWLASLDTPQMAKLGANAILGVSLAVAVAGAAAKGVPLYQHIADLADNPFITLPIPSFNVINGGAHAGNKMPFQEFMIMPTGCQSFSECMKVGVEVYQHLKSIIKKSYGQDAINVGDEGGFAPNIDGIEECLTLLTKAVAAAGYTDKVRFAIDVAASEFHCQDRPGHYNLDYKNPQASNPKIVSGGELAEIYRTLVQKFPIVSIEDPFDQDDFASWALLTSIVPIQIVGDDLTVTNSNRIKMAVERKACNTLLLKVNQIGTLTLSIAAAKLAKSSGWNVMVSHRSGETEDTFIADLAVGLGAGQIKAGAPCRSERLAKYNQLLRIEEKLRPNAQLAKPERISNAQ